MKTVRLAISAILTTCVLTTCSALCFADDFRISDVRTQAEQGNTDAQLCLAEYYRLGLGISKSNAEAVEWIRRASERGDPEAQFRYGLLFDKGDLGVKQNYSEAFKWFHQSAEQGNQFGQLGLGLMYHEGRGAPKDYALAAKWLRKAAQQGHPSAQHVLGSLYFAGFGVKKDVVEAYKWVSLGLARQGYSDAQKELADIKSTMTSEQIKEAERRANDFRPISTTKKKLCFGLP